MRTTNAVPGSFSAGRAAYIGRWIGLAAVLGAAALAPATQAADVTYQRLLNPEPHNWLMVHRDYTAQRHSALDQINKSNIKNLKLQFAVAIGGTSPNEGLQVTPLVDDGYMYVIDGWGVVYKIDVRSGNHGRILWKMDPGMKRYGRIRGVALWGNLVISPTGKDGRIIATDKESGKIVWDKNLSDHPELELSAAPLALKDDIIIGGSGGDQGTRNWLASLDPKTGDLKWKTYAIPAPGEPGSETWKDKNEAWKTGGGAFYVTGSYDPQTNLTIWGSGNPVPGYDATRRPGDNLFTSSAIAFDVANGKMKWFFQYTPNDSRDYDETGTHVLIDDKVNGQDRKLVTHAGRNGFNYTFDRVTGQFLKAGQYVAKVTWTKGIDAMTPPRICSCMPSRPAPCRTRVRGPCAPKSPAATTCGRPPTAPRQSSSIFPASKVVRISPPTTVRTYRANSRAAVIHSRTG
jgi:alcohol dehydrogenase (cytochrome c)